MKTDIKIIIVLIGLPSLFISLFLQWLILKNISADSLMWFLYWFNMPFAFITIILSKIFNEK
jgi:hypothetical protein